jgi:integrase
MRGHVRQRGAGWVVVVDHGRDEAGRRKQKWLSGYRSKKEAEQALTKMPAAKDNGERLPEAPTKVTFGTFLLEKWLPHLANRVQVGSLRESTYAFYTDIVIGHIVPGVGHVRLRALDDGQLEAFYAELLRTGRKVRRGEAPAGLGPTRVRAIHATITSSLRWAVRQHLRTTNPASEVSAVPRRSADQRPCWTHEQTATFLAATQEDILYPLYLFAATTGMRRGEVVGLHWEQVDLDAGQVTISRTRVSIGGPYS